jgi:uncharacterized protein with FMN-binding domain
MRAASLVAAALLALLPAGEKNVPRPSGGAVRRTPAEVDALIKKVGPTAPEWFAATPLTYPPTLDLSWPEPPPTKEWDQSRNMGQYIWSVINENPSRWHEGVKLLHHLLTLHKDDRVKLRRVMVALGHLYAELLEDYPRGAFWWRKALALRGDDDGLELSLADLYFKLGSKEMAVKIISRFESDFTRHGNVIKLWSDMGETGRALEMAEACVGDYPAVCNLCAGDVCRLAGRYDDALRYYQKVLDSPDGEGDIPRIKNRARANLEAIRLFEKLDLKRIPDGAYRSQSLGYEAPIEVEVAVKGGKIADVRVLKHREKQFYSAISDTTRKILEKQSVRGIDATSSATITSEAIINATAKALSGAMR